MNETKENKGFEFLSLILILSYSIMHNIIPVLIGIILSLYLINIEYLNRFSRSFKLMLHKSQEYKDYKNDKFNNSKLNIKENNEKNDSSITLVEMIEELGFIPAKDENDDCNAA
tara:strand:+ start:294 stop:635 length:342 start_codon:yes stop_codon:yes gene_type:complete